MNHLRTPTKNILQSHESSLLLLLVLGKWKSPETLVMSFINGRECRTRGRSSSSPLTRSSTRRDPSRRRTPGTHDFVRTSNTQDLLDTRFPPVSSRIEESHTVCHEVSRGTRWTRIKTFKCNSTFIYNCRQVRSTRHKSNAYLGTRPGNGIGSLCTNRREYNNDRVVYNYSWRVLMELSGHRHLLVNQEWRREGE